MSLPSFKVPKTARPTASRVREAVFNIWQAYLTDCLWLDLCAGSGAMGAEALARGAKLVVAIDVNPHACKVITQNLGKLSTPDRFCVIKIDAIKGVEKLTDKFDLIYFDPPYASNLYLPVLERIGGICHTHTKIAVEHSSSYPLPTTIGELHQTDRRLYGQTCLSFFAWQG